MSQETIAMLFPLLPVLGIGIVVLFLRRPWQREGTWSGFPLHNERYATMIFELRTDDEKATDALKRLLKEADRAKNNQ